MRRLLAFLAVFLVLGSLPQNLNAQTTHSQGLEWGFQEGDRFDFVETYTEDDPENPIHIQMDYYLIAPEASVIPDPLTVNDSVLLRRADIYFRNGTKIPSPGIRFAVPIGNWSLLTEIRSATNEMYYQSGEILDEPSYWGFSYDEGGNWSSSTTRFEFAKVDGVLLTIVYTASDIYTNISHTMTVVRVTSFTMDPTILGLVAIGGLTILVIVLLIWERRG